MKIWLKRTFLGLACACPIAFVVAFSTTWTKSIPVSCVGSSGVKPFVEEFANTVHNEPGFSNIDITVEAGGSGFGIAQVANNFANIGNASKNPYSSVLEDGLKDEWVHNNIKTVTIAWEAICLIYIPPKGLSASQADLNKFLNIKNADSLEKLYRSFSGFGNQPVLGDFWNDGISNENKNLFDNTPIVPYVRTGGSMVSGTAASFFKEASWSSEVYDKLEEKYKEAFEIGKYGNDYKVVETDEANSRAWSMFNKDNKPGSMVYLSSSFVEQNRKLIEKNGYGIVEYNGVEYSAEKISQPKGYDWYRPINTMVPIQSQESAAMKFIEYLLARSPNEWKKIGGASLTDTQKNSMKKDGDLWKTDVEISKIRNSEFDWRKVEDKKTIFGASK